MSQPPREFYQLRRAVEQCNDINAILDALVELRPYIWHQRGYVDALISDLENFAQTGTYDFSDSRDAFSKPLTETLLLFPAALANQSSDHKLECAWLQPSWSPNGRDIRRMVDVPERFVPCDLIATSTGFSGDCAVFFPEHVAARRASRSPQPYALFFTKLEATRLQRILGQISEFARVHYDVTTERTTELFSIWDVLHDTAHDTGPLPLSKYVIHGNVPIWVEAAEELRADIIAYNCVTVPKLSAQDLSDVRHTIVVDRALRFPLTAPMASYDSIAGQTMFGFMANAKNFRLNGSVVHCHALGNVQFDPLLDAIETTNAGWSSDAVGAFANSMFGVLKPYVDPTGQTPLGWHASARSAISRVQSPLRT